MKTKKINELQQYLTERKFSQIFVLTDENTSKYALPILLEKVDEISDAQASLLELPCGEKYKSLESARDLCLSLLESNADRNSVLISLGGGVITDIGAFVASIYKRGIQNINLPTTLLAMTDAAIGGKTGVNLGQIKNAVGTFNADSVTFVDTEFMLTLNERELLGGMAEMIKTFLVGDKIYLEKILKTKDLSEINEDLIFRCIEIKEEIVSGDFYDNGERKKLNFGHTLGHAFESLFLDREDAEPLSHGHAVAIGMFYALKLSEKKFGTDFSSVRSFLESRYAIPNMAECFKDLIPYILNDKKSKEGKMRFVLLKEVGNAVIDVEIETEEIARL
ncbi:MAG: 3-dehydroquinate synthase [Bacteroidales bacterium]|nr:3-dehydroquinate synthase [Bacteroidales bacterium]